ncbi:hypothetical protein Pdw03_0634 [Penicillium digitatum]|uniref:Uncharacterized protein n=1 Tax=Penicillium digitatum TaxID=36651 RepID=A0A7T7BMZ0_PENDI|nr:hypothetical protein Pdw03_0634 [Penicillium digitatum]
MLLRRPPGLEVQHILALDGVLRSTPYTSQNPRNESERYGKIWKSPNSTIKQSDTPVPSLDIDAGSWPPGTHRTGHIPETPDESLTWLGSYCR